jgi:pimeloyl-ACP methyl ester carboxylesterase
MNTTTPTTRAHRGLIATILITMAAAAVGLVSVNAGGASADHRPESPKPTIVFVHGGWADASGWNAQVADLQKRGYPVIAPANPQRGLKSDSDYIRSVLTTIDGPIVLVGHSYGGAVISNAAVGVPNVKALVFIAAFAPDAGESLAQLVTMNPGTGIGPDTLTPRPYPLPGGGQGTDLYLTVDGFRNAFAGDVPRKIADQMQAEQRPFSQEAFAEPSAEPAWKTIPSWYLLTTQDKAIPPVTQRFMAQRAGAHIEEVRASHVPMISKPDSVTRLILEAANAIS